MQDSYIMYSTVVHSILNMKKKRIPCNSNNYIYKITLIFISFFFIFPIFHTGVLWNTLSSVYILPETFVQLNVSFLITFSTLLIFPGIAN